MGRFMGLPIKRLAIGGLVLLLSFFYVWAVWQGWVLALVHPVLVVGLSVLGIAIYIYVHQLGQSAQRFRAIVEATPVPLLIIDPPSGMVVYANGSGEALFENGKAKGKSVTDLLPAEDWENLRQIWQRDGEVTGYELLCRSDLWAIAAIRSLPQAHQPDLILTLTDITALKQTTESLRRAEANYRSIFENAIEGIFQASPDNTLMRINDSFAKIFGYASATEMLGKVRHFNSLYADGETEGEFQHLMAQRSEILGWEYPAYRCDRSIIWIRQSTRAVRNPKGDLLYYEGIVEDVSQRRRQEEELRQQMAELQVEIDESRRAKQVAEITETDFFKQLQAEADALRSDN
jgi:PAS domain S-box-containing protein